MTDTNVDQSSALLFPSSPPALPPPLRSRMHFMLDTIKALRTNNIHRIPNYDPSLLEHSKKLLKRFIRSTGTSLFCLSSPSLFSFSVLPLFLLFLYALLFSSITAPCSVGSLDEGQLKISLQDLLNADKQGHITAKTLGLF